MKKAINLKYKDWLFFAGEDILVAKLAMGRGICNQVCFHSQQVAEKSLKAFIKARQGLIPKVHNLIELFKLCSKISEKITFLKESCEYLNKFYAPTRYPDAFPGSLADRLPNEKEAGKALECSLLVI